MTRTIRSNGQEALCAAIADARKSMGLSQYKLARRLGCQQSLVARIESGQRRIDVVEFIVLVRGIGSDLYAILAVVEAAIDLDHRI